MSFNHFRIVVTLLACFCPFFAYICRLNLSLTIDEMVYKDEITVNSTLEYDEIEVRPSPVFPTEEHTLAWISESRRRHIVVRSGNSTIALEVSAGDGYRRRSNLDGDQISPLAIEFDADPGRERAQKQVSQIRTSQDETHSNQQPKIQANLLYWSQEDRNDLLGAFFFGYLVFQIPGARAAEMFGAKSLYIVAGLGSGLCSLVFPFVSKHFSNIIYAYIIRVIMGASQGAMFPTGYVFICEWLPKSERSRWLPVPTSFSRIGTTVMGLLVPLIMLQYSWEMVFYASGVLMLMWTIIFAVFGSNSPSQSFWLSKDELVYIESHMEPRVGTLNQQPSITASGFSINEAAKDAPQAQPPISWSKIITSKPIMILTLAMFVSEWSNMILLIKLPGFLGPVLKMDLADIGFWSSCLIGLYSIHCPLSGIVASKLESLELDWLDSLRVRKVFEFLAHFLQGIACVMIAFSSDRVVILSALFVMMIGRATVGGGQCLMPPELSKEYPGTVFAYANTIANTAGVIGPKAVNWLVSDPREHDSWFYLWLTSAALFFGGGLIFCLFADNSPQNYCRKPKPRGPIKALSEAQLTLDKNPQQIIKMEALSRVNSEPDPVTRDTSRSRIAKLERKV